MPSGHPPPAPTTASEDPAARPPRPARLLVATVAALVVVLVATLGALALGLLAATSERSTRGPADSPTPTTTAAGPGLVSLRIPRAGFCERLDPAEVTTALRGPVTATGHYDSGEVAPLEPGLRERAHEFGCSFRTVDGTRARAWVFADPVTVAEATAVARGLLAEPGCRPLPGAPAFGRPGTATSCPGGTGRDLTLAGAFGSTWLSCRLSLPDAGLASVRRAERWCTSVATSIASG